MVDMLEFFKVANRLKWVERRGWVAKVNVGEPESVAAHSYLMTLMCMVIADKKEFNSGKIVKMALLHDLAESIIGDHMPEDLSTEEKQKRETKAIREILHKLPVKIRRTYMKLWEEYTRMSSRESVLVHQIDKLEMALQASDYRRKGYDDKLLEQFFISAKEGMRDRELLKMLNDLKHAKV